jgi:2-polyprenyl-6-methoxyphenol hydroxylase-like FAD-dependent oxidoreductase
MTKTLGRRAIVVGASIAGLMTARVLSEYFDHVVTIERDEIEDRPVVHKSVPQGHHLHAFLQGGLNVVSSLYPSITEELRRLGATRIAMGRNAVWYMPNGKAYNFTGSVRTPFDSGLEGYCASRGLLEFVIRRRTAAISNIHFEYGTAVTELICRDATVVGVRCGDSRSIEADLVVDATGRAHRARQWLAAIGFSPPEETEIGLDTAYSTANFRRPESYSGEPLIFITGPSSGSLAMLAAVRRASSRVSMPSAAPTAWGFESGAPRGAPSALKVTRRATCDRKERCRITESKNLETRVRPNQMRFDPITVGDMHRMTRIIELKVIHLHFFFF